MAQSQTCPRGRSDCCVANNIIAETGGSFICVGFNRKEDREVPQDRFTLCWKNSVIDERGHWDKRDLLDTMCVIGTALSIDENIRVAEGLTEDQMQQINMLP